jgi:hypothetical protein
MSVNEASEAEGIIAPELADVLWPWDDADIYSHDLAQLSDGPEEIERALHSFRALLQFMASHREEIARSEEEAPALAVAPWIAWTNDLVARMPRFSNFTWQNFRAWAEDFSPAWIESSWDEPPSEFVHAAAWLWTSGSVEESADAVVDWLSKRINNRDNRAFVIQFLEICATFTSKVGGYGSKIIAVMGRVAASGDVSYLDRIAADPDLPDGPRAALDSARSRLIAKRVD